MTTGSSLRSGNPFIGTRLLYEKRRGSRKRYSRRHHENQSTAHLQVTGEAARGLSPRVTHGHPDVPWAQIIALRNILVHEYFGLNMRQVWTTVTKDLPDFEERIRKILAEIKD